MKKLNKKGFTLIELLVVIAIIGLLSTLAVVALNNARAKSRDAKRVADVKQIQTALEMFFNECSSYPAVDAGLTLDSAGAATMGALATNCTTAGISFATFMAQIPEAPSPADGACTTNNPYVYTSTTATGGDCAVADAPCASYTLAYCLGATTGGLPAGVTLTANPAGMR